MIKNHRETLTATALVAAIAGAALAQVLDRPSPQPSPPVHAYLMPAQPSHLMPALPSQAPARLGHRHLEPHRPAAR
jgi:hypothetical protein